MNQQEPSTDSLPKPRLHGINTIFICSLFFTSFIGALLMVQNLKKLGRRAGALIIASIGLVYLLLLLLPTYLGERSLSMGLGVNVVIDLLLCFFYFNMYYPGEGEYEEQVMLAGIVTSVLSLGAFIGFIYVFDRWLRMDQSLSLLVSACILFYAIFTITPSFEDESEPETRL